MRNKSFINGFLLAFVLSLVLAFALEKWLVYVGIAPHREPAAIDRGHLFDSNIATNSALKAVSARQLLAETRVVVHKGQIDISLGAATAAGTKDTKSLCAIYDRVELRFEGDGIAVDGERPSLTVSGPCAVDTQAVRSKPLVIPYADLKSRPPVESEFSYGAKHEFLIKLSHLNSLWPDQWVLTEVKLSKSGDPSAIYYLDRHEVYNFATHPIVLNW